MRLTSSSFRLFSALVATSLSLAVACGDDDGMLPPVTTDGGVDSGSAAAHPLRSGAEVSFAEVYTATTYAAGPADSREWLPMDLAAHPSGELWVVQQMERATGFDEFSECTMAGVSGSPNDCVSLNGSTVAITEPASAEPASQTNGRARLVVDFNAWHFMRRPAAIAFGAEELRLEPSDPGADGANLSETLVLRDTFATCHEHWTGNLTDGGAFIGPSLWTADPAIYDGSNGSHEWSNGSHLDMVHATQYCMGIAYEQANVYWVFNGEEGALDRYDFKAPHHPGHHDHDDGDVTRFLLNEGDELARVESVPSNMVLEGSELFVADTGNGRVLRFDISSPVQPGAEFFTFERLPAMGMLGMAYAPIADSATLETEWNGAAQPSGLAILDADTLVVANHATGHLSLIDRTDGALVRTIDTGTGAGLGGLTVIGGQVYFVQMNERRIYRVDVVAE